MKWKALSQSGVAEVPTLLRRPGPSGWKRWTRRSGNDFRDSSKVSITFFILKKGDHSFAFLSVLLSCLLSMFVSVASKVGIQPRDFLEVTFSIDFLKRTALKLFSSFFSFFYFQSKASEKKKNDFANNDARIQRNWTCWAESLFSSVCLWMQCSISFFFRNYSLFWQVVNMLEFFPGIEVLFMLACSFISFWHVSGHRKQC